MANFSFLERTLDDERSILIPEEPPSPISYWIDLHPLDDCIKDVPEISPEPLCLRLDLHPLDDANSTPEVSPSALTFRLEEE